MKADFLSLEDGLKIHIEIVKTRSNSYNEYTFTVSDRKPFSGKAPKGWTTGRILSYWWRGECVETTA